jgi:hypothetical protein
MLRDPSFWSALIALTALALSQLPPVHEWLKPGRLRIVVPDLVQVYHYLGNISVQMFLALHNTGGRNLTVQKMECILASEDQDLQRRLQAQTYLAVAAGSSQTEMVIGWILLKPEEHWSQTVRFYKVWSVQDEEEAADIVALIKGGIDAKFRQRTPQDQNMPVEADAPSVEKARKFFDRNFNLAKGTYKLLVAAVSEKGDLLAVSGFSFTLFDHQIKSLRSAADDYKIGAGIYFSNSDPYKGTAMIRLRPLAEDEARTLYTRLIGR